MCNYCGYGTYGYSPYQQYGYGYGASNYGLSGGYGFGSGLGYGYGSEIGYGYGASNYGLSGGYGFGASSAPFLATVVPVSQSFASFAPAPTFASFAPMALSRPRGEYRAGNCLCICQ